MKSLSLRAKLLVVSLVTITALAVLLTWRSYSGINDLSTELSNLTEKNLTEATVTRLQTEAHAYGEQIGGYLNSAYRIPLTLADILANSIQSENRLGRDEVNEMFGQILKSNKDISSVYVQFEANAYDGQDELYTDDFIHSIPGHGSFETYWYLSEDTGAPTQVQIDDVNEKYNSTRNEFGFRVAEWFYCPKETLKPCATEPYKDEVEDNMYELMTTLAAPVVVNNSFRGVVGIDINLSEFQQLTEKLSNSLYNGAPKVSIISEYGLIIGSSHHADKVSRPITEIYPQLGNDLKQLYKNQGVLFNNGRIYVSEPIEIKSTKTHWSLLIELPTDVALAQLNELKDISLQKQSSVISGLIIISILLAAGSLVTIFFVVRSISRPIGVLNQQVEQLASAEGDLSHRLELDTHAELIVLGKNFNRFMHKLRDLVIALKDISLQVRHEAGENLAISNKTSAATEEQQGEIDNVVTATQEMSATAGEVAKIAADVAERANDIHQTVIDSQQNLSQAVESSLELSESMNVASDSISKVAARSNDINGILDVIRNVAEQTNLLALNAAIEAARAGEQGRGFAVVADEVRTLASRTQTSTEEINTLIADLQTEVSQAVNIIQRGTEQTGSAMESTRQAHEHLHRVVEAIGEIADNIRQVATAAEEQSSVSEEITRNLTVIGDAAQTLANLAQQANQSSQHVTSQLDQLDQQLGALRT